MPQDDNFKEGDIVEFISPFSKRGKGDLVKISLPDRQAGPDPSLHPPKDGSVQSIVAEKRGTENDLYTYRAWVYRVLDGDTIEAVIDLGFGITTTQTLRFRGIDAPEILTKDGKEAKEFVEEMLGTAENVKGTGTISPPQNIGRVRPLAEKNKMEPVPGMPVLIKTVKSDKYDRYLADVFITDKDGKEQYLNNLLFEKGHAVRVQS